MFASDIANDVNSKVKGGNVRQKLSDEPCYAGLLEVVIAIFGND